MRKKFILKAILILFFLVLLIGCNNVPKFDQYGVYVKGIHGYKEIKGYVWDGLNGICENSQKYDQTPIEVNNNYEIYIYSPQAKTMNYKLLIPDLRSENGNLVHADYAIGLFSTKSEISVNHIHKLDNMVKINFQKDEGIFILLNTDNKGITGYLFNLKSKYKKSNANINRQEILLDFNRIDSLAEVFYKTPKSHGGAGRNWSSEIDNFGKSLSYYSYNASTNTLLTRHGSFIFSLNNDSTILTITGIGDEKGKDKSTGVKATLTISDEAKLREVSIIN